MAPLELFFHVLGFVAPAVAVALLVAAGGPILLRSVPGRSWRSQAAINSVVGVLVSGAGLWVFGADGKMATYAALVAAIATSQWAGQRAWRG